MVLRSSPIPMILAHCMIFLGILQTIVQGQETEDANYRIFEQLEKDGLSPGQRTELLIKLVEALDGTDESLILFVLGKQMRKHAVAREVVLPRLAELLAQTRQDSYPDLRMCRIIETLLSAGEVPPGAVLDVEAVWKDTEAFPCAAPKAAALLLCIDPSRKEVQTWFGNKLQGKSHHERLTAAAALGRAGKRAAPMVAKVQPLLKDEAADVRVVAAVSLWKITGRSAGLVSALQMSLREEPTGVILRPFTLSESGLSHLDIAVMCLGEMREGAREAAGDVARLLKQRDTTLRCLAARTLGLIGARTPEVLSALEAATRDSHPGVAEAAAEALQVLKG